MKPGDAFAHFRVVSALGAGGMGEVYRATDAKLRRDVALKVLPAEFVADSERLARFEREAQLLAQLHHPNIASIFGLEESGGVRALVMELVEGPTLAERLERGSLPLDECLSIARQIADALEDAHEKGIVHRDLKPQNVKASIEGRVKVLDFGLAKALDPVAGSSSAASQLAQSPTLTLGATAYGVILGTAAYMSPEQAKGVQVDKRADIWAFGVVLFEMLAGRRLFAGESVTETLADVLRSEIDFGLLPHATPPAIRRLLRRCLERNPKNRLHDVADARIVIDEVLAGRTDAAPIVGPTAAPARAPLARWAAVAAAGIALGVLAGWLAGRSGAPAADAGEAAPPVYRQLTREPGGEGWPSLSPDGGSFVYVKSVGGQRDIFLQRVDGRNAINLTADCAGDDLDPAYSPDGRWIAYSSSCRGGGLFVMGATGESARKISDTGFSPAWSPDGRELAAVDYRTDTPESVAGLSSLWAVRVDSGERRLISRRSALEPDWSPDGRRIAFWDFDLKTFQRDLWTVAADGSDVEAERAVAVTRDAPLDWSPVWDASGAALLFGSSRNGAYNLWRIAVDPASGKGRGRPEPLTVPSGWAGWPSLAKDGRRVAFVDRNARSTVVRVAFDPVAGRFAAAPTPAFQGSFELFEQELSPDGGWILFSNAGLPANLHVVRVDGSGYRQVVEGEFRDRQAHLSPDGRTIAFQTSRWPGGLALVRTDGSGLREIPAPLDAFWEARWSRDGARLAANSSSRFAIIDLSATPPAVRYQKLPAEGLVFGATSWSPDGESILGSVLRQGRWSYFAVFSPRDETYRRVGEPVTVSDETDGRLPDIYATLAPDGRSFVYAEDDRLLLAALDGSPTRELYRAAPEHTLRRPTFSRDGRWLTFLDSADESDIWLAEFERSGGKPAP